MKIGRLIILGLAGYASYQAYINRDKIKQEFLETKEITDTINLDISRIKSNLAKLNTEKDNIQQISQDLSYKLRVFNQETQASLTEIKIHTDKYKN